MNSTIIRASRSIRTIASVILLTLFLLPAASRAANVTVGCPGGSGGTYPSINAALNAIGQTGPHTITVTGTCAESVFLFNARSILIIAPSPGGATIVGFQDSDTFDIQQSQDITLQNLEIRGNAASSFGFGVSIFTNSQANIISCNIHDNPDGGVSADTVSLVALNQTTLQNSSNGDGLDLTNDSTADMVSTTIQNNAGVGISVFNRSGIVIRRQNLIQNNAGGFGIYATDLSKVQMQRGDPTLFTTIQDMGRTESLLAIRSCCACKVRTPSRATAPPVPLTPLAAEFLLSETRLCAWAGQISVAIRVPASPWNSSLTSASTTRQSRTTRPTASTSDAFPSDSS